MKLSHLHERARDLARERYPLPRCAVARELGSLLELHERTVGLAASRQGAREVDPGFEGVADLATLTRLLHEAGQGVDGMRQVSLLDRHACERHFGEQRRKAVARRPQGRLG